MSKKDFVMLAAAIAELPLNTTRADVAKAIAVAIMNTNHGFKMQAFLNACTERKAS